MRKSAPLFSLAILAALALSCQKEDPVREGQVYLDLPEQPYNYRSGNSYQQDMKATLGRVLFYDKHLSINNSVACASCHKQQFAFADNVALSRGFDNRQTNRNSMPIQNFIFSGVVIGPRLFFWDGRENNIENLSRRPLANHVEMGIPDLSELPAKLQQLPHYPGLFREAFGSEEITTDRMASAMAAFMMAIESKHTRFDLFESGNSAALNALELKGQALFNTTYDCASCHRVSLFSYAGDEMMNIGLPYANGDIGAAALHNNAPEMMGVFRIPNLRNVALTAPYMHDGRFKTLEDVLEHYSHGIQDDPNLDDRLKDVQGRPMRMNIPAEDKQAIVAFLNTLTDPVLTTDPRYSDPFKVK